MFRTEIFITEFGSLFQAAYPVDGRVNRYWILSVFISIIFVPVIQWFRYIYMYTYEIWLVNCRTSAAEITHSTSSVFLLLLFSGRQRESKPPRCTGCEHMYGPCQNQTSIINDLSMMYRALWDRRHEGATRISQCTSALTYLSGPWVPPISQCTIHHA